MKIIAIIPAFNEKNNIANVIKDIATREQDLDILVIDDGSSDNTSATAQAAEKALVITLPFNVGVGAAMQTGFKYAKRNGYDIVVRFDGDGQHKAEEIRKILKPILEKENDLVIGSRFLGKQNYPIELSRRIGQKIISFFTSFIADQKISDATSGFRCYNRKAILLLNRYYPISYPEPEEIIFIKKNGFRIKEVGVQMENRQEGKSSLTATNSIYYMARVILSIFVNLLRTPVLKEK